MKKIIATIIISLTILISGLTTFTINNTNAKNSEDSTNRNDYSLSNTLPILNSQHETIYAITNSSGSIQKTFVENILNNSEEPLPINLKVTYYLDGTEISADNLIGKSGHIRIVYNYTSTKTYQDKLIPFLALTGISLDNTKFTNLKITNGKILSENKNTFIAGYSLVGLNENLGTDFLPSTFEIEADTTDFTLDTTYTVATNDFFANLDTSKLTSIDYIINSINDLSAGFDQIVRGATDLNNGLGQLSSGLTTLKTKVDTISTKVLSITNEAEEIVAKFNHLLDSSSELLETIPSTPTKTITAIEELATEYDLNPELTTKITDIVNANYDEAYSAIMNHADQTLSKLTQTSSTVSNYLTKIKNNTIELKNGVDKLTDGANALYYGSTKLKNGLLTFKSRGINQLVSFANNDLDNFVRNLRQTIDAASSYHSYATPTAKSTKFIFKTPKI
ncbi:methyl-accepting chemotaxis protein [Candidatus Saccharibacteria bacterium]|nr:methyl-accepting chemotaxis protein [Candidatus Saccharibacteria bacterium]